MPTVGHLLEAVTSWASARSDIVGVALLGSHARNTANAKSDIDLILLTPVPNAFRESSKWPSEIDWSTLGVSIASWRDADYGVVWSRQIELSDGMLLELSFAYPSWAATSPCDVGTRSVVSQGCRVLFDPQHLLQNLVRHAA